MSNIYPRLRVFVSSKMEELAPERKAIKVALDTLQVDGWVFEEDAGARAESIQQSYLEEVEAADLYVGIYWKGYGDYTNEEYEHADKLGKDCLIYEKRTDLEQRDPKLQSFLDRLGQVETGRTIKYFKTPEELGEVIQQDVAHWQTRKVRERQTPINVSLSLAEKKQRNELLILLGKVKNYWIEGILEQSVHSEALIALSKEQWAENEDTHGEQILELPDQTSRALSPGQSNGELFDEVGRSLLILGAPGSGKTTTLLDLTRDLIKRAERDPVQPIPVVLNLSSWAEKRLSLLDWLIEELNSKYRVPKKIGRTWLEERWLLPMLDGLDEVRGEYRAECIKTVNAFVDENGVPGLVVCSRLNEYMALTERLKTGGAICLQPLKPEQVRDYLERAGAELEGLGIALQRDQVLQTLAETPLMLSIMSLAYWGADSDQMVTQQASSPKERRDQIFSLYVDQMFQRKQSADRLFPKDKIIGWLSWLAKKMQEQSQSVFMMEELQPSWLGPIGPRVAYGALVALIIGLIVGLIVGLIDGLYVRRFGLDLGLIGGLIEGLIGGLAVLLVCWSASPLKNGVIVGLIVALFFALIVGLRFGLDRGLTDGLLGGAGVGLFVGVGVGSLNRIPLVEVMSWNWKRGWKKTIRGGWIIGLFSGLIGCLYFGLWHWKYDLLSDRLIGVLYLGLFSGLIGGLIGGLVSGLFGGLTDTVKVDKASPNEGIKLSGKNAIFAFVIGFLIFGLSAGAGGGAGINRIFLPIFGLIGGLFGGLFVGLNRGGSAVVKHYSLRLILWVKGYTPFRFIGLLDYCAELIFLKKVGGGYIFIHRMLLEYFAELDTVGQKELERQSAMLKQ